MLPILMRIGLLTPYATFDWNGAFDAGIEGAMDGLILGGIWKGGSILKGF